MDQAGDLNLLAKEARYNAQKFAVRCGVSPRQLRRYFETKHQITTHKWLHELRMRRAVELVRDKTPIKETASELGYKDATHFTHDFTHHFGVAPSKFGGQQPDLGLETKNVRF